jgi:streptogramin lyase
MVQRHKDGFVAALCLAAAIELLGWSASASAQSITEYSIPTTASGPNGIAAGPDGALWFTESNANKIGRITTSGTITEFGIPTPSSGPFYIAAGPDGALWFSENSGNKIGRITTSGTITEFGIPTSASEPAGIAAGPDGALWFTEGFQYVSSMNPGITAGGNKIGRIATSGAITEFPVPTASSNPVGIAAGPDGALWFAENGSFHIQRGTVPGKIGRITTAGVVTEYPLPPQAGPVAGPIGIAAGPDGALWFGAASATGNVLLSSIDRITTSGMVTPYSVVGLPEDIAAGAEGRCGLSCLTPIRSGVSRHPVQSPDIPSRPPGAARLVSQLGRMARCGLPNTTVTRLGVLPRPPAPARSSPRCYHRAALFRSATRPPPSPPSSTAFRLRRAVARSCRSPRCRRALSTRRPTPRPTR